MSLRCLLGRHAVVVRDRAADGTQVMRCSECWKICPYPATDVAALRAEQQRQRAAIVRKQQWRKAVGER